jgi:hypothetical protein
VCGVCTSEPLSSSSSSRAHPWRGYSTIRSCSQSWTATPTLAMAADRCVVLAAYTLPSNANLWYACGRGALPGANRRTEQSHRSLSTVVHLPAGHVQYVQDHTNNVQLTHGVPSSGSTNLHLALLGLDCNYHVKSIYAWISNRRTAAAAARPSARQLTWPRSTTAR